MPLICMWYYLWVMQWDGAGERMGQFLDEGRFD